MLGFISRDSVGKASRLCYWLSAVFTSFLILAFIASISIDYLYHSFYAPGPSLRPVVVVIKNNSSLLRIGKILGKYGVIASRGFFLWDTFVAGKVLFSNSKTVKAAEWRFEPKISMADTVELMSSGPALLHKFTFLEGWTSAQVAAQLNENEVLEGPLLTAPEEGQLMPDTYLFSRGKTRQEVLGNIRNAMESFLLAAWNDRAADLPLSNKFELLTLASIVEREGSIERARIAGVFVQRLRKNMRLEADPTVLYGIYRGAAWNKARLLTKADLRNSDNPYNTYKIRGLPPGPICNPSKASILAAANPRETADLFFVADGNGGHRFSKTLAEHNKNVLKLRTMRRGAD